MLFSVPKIYYPPHPNSIPRIYCFIVDLPPYTVITPLLLCLPHYAKSFKGSSQCLSHCAYLR